jgi:hypothetical protein
MKKCMFILSAVLAAVLICAGEPLAQQGQTPESTTASDKDKDIAAKNPIHNMEMPGISEQHRQLAALVGNWTIKGHTFKGCPYGEGTFTAREHNEFMKGGMFLVSKTQYSSLFKDSNQIAFFGVDPTTKQYTYAMYNNTGIIVQASGEMRDKANAKLVGNAIKWTEKKVNVDMHGAQPTMVYTTEVISPREYRFSLEAGGVRWYEGTATKVESVNPNPTQQ